MSERYHMTTNYSDGYTKDEYSDDIVAVLQAASIYLGDRDCWRVAVFDTAQKTWVVDFMR